MEEKKVLLSVKDLDVKFRVRGRVLTAIRGISLDIYENETIAIVGESGSGKSVFTKTFAGMLDSNGFIDHGQIIFSDDELADTVVQKTAQGKNLMKRAYNALNKNSHLELGAETYRKILKLESEKRQREGLSDKERREMEDKIHELVADRTDLFNEMQTYDPHSEKEKIHSAKQRLNEYDDEVKKLQKEFDDKVKERKASAKHDSEYLAEYNRKMSELKAQYDKECSAEISEKVKERNDILSKEIWLSVGRYPPLARVRLTNKLVGAIKKAQQVGVDLSNENLRNRVFDTVVFRVAYLDENEERLHGTCILNLANMKYSKDWTQVRGRRIATVFQDPMTSLNPILTIGKQITSIIIKHQKCSESEARARALELMHKVGIPNPETRFDDYPFQYSGGMRQRIVIAIALSCQPKILICDEPTTALDVTIQAQILQLIKDLQKEFGYTTVFITHDLGVVANVADRVAVLYAGQIVELGTVEEVFYDPRHPYTWALLSSLPQLAQRNTKLYSITGTPPSLYNNIVGDSFAPRNPYCLKIDTIAEPPMFQISPTHYAKTWLLDPRAPKVEKPEIIQNIHEKLVTAFNIQGV